MANPSGQVSKLLQLEKSGSSVCETPSPGRVTRSIHLIPRFNPPDGSYPTVVGGLQIMPSGQVRLAPAVVDWEKHILNKRAQKEKLTLSRTKNSERYLAELRNLPPGQIFLLFQPYPSADSPSTRGMFNPGADNSYRHRGVMVIST